MYTPPFARTCANTNTLCRGVCYQYRMSHRSLPTCWIDTFIDSRRFRRPTRLFVATVRGALRERVGRHYSRARADCERVSSGVQSVAGVCTVGCRGGTTPYYGDLVLTSGSKTHAWQFGILSKFAFHSHGSFAKHRTLVSRGAHSAELWQSSPHERCLVKPRFHLCILCSVAAPIHTSEHVHSAPIRSLRSHVCDCSNLASETANTAQEMTSHCDLFSAIPLDCEPAKSSLAVSWTSCKEGCRRLSQMWHTDQ